MVVLTMTSDLLQGDVDALEDALLHVFAGKSR